MRKILLSTAILSTLSFCLPAQANDVGFSVGTGYPYVGSLELSLPANEGKQRWFANYKMGLDDGFSLGFEQGYGNELNHALGGLVGAVGIYKGDDNCTATNTNNGDLVESITESFAQSLGCALSAAFNDETLNGVGLSYSYYVNGINKSGWRFKLEAGYGKASNSGDKLGTGGLIVSYQF